MSNNYRIWEIPTRDHEMLRKHEINNELRDIDFNISQKAIDQQRSTTPSMTIFA